MRLKLIILLVIIVGMTASCECEANAPVMAPQVVQKEKDPMSFSNLKWISDEEDSWNNPVFSSYFDHQNFVSTVQGKWKQLLGKNGSLKIDGYEFQLIDPGLDLNITGSFTYDNVHGFFGNGNIFDYIHTISGKRTHLQMILETDSILRIGIFSQNGSKHSHKIVVFKKADN